MTIGTAHDLRITKGAIIVRAPPPHPASTSFGGEFVHGTATPSHSRKLETALDPGANEAMPRGEG